MVLPTLLLTRPRDSANAFAATLDPAALARVRVVIAPLMRIAATGATVEMAGIRGVIFTSGNGVIHAPPAQGLSAYCVGAQTTHTARALGWQAQQMGDTAQQLTAALMAAPPALPLLHLGGVHTRGEIAQTLTLVGITTAHVAVYDQILVPLDTAALEALEGQCIVPVFSPRSAVALMGQAGGRLHQAHVVALSDSVAAPFGGELTASMTIPERPQTAYMRKGVENLCLNLSLP
jgi:uroporphyrinogen-III synthase